MTSKDSFGHNTHNRSTARRTNKHTQQSLITYFENTITRELKVDKDANNHKEQKGYNIPNGVEDV